MGTPIENNTTVLQEILAEVEALPSTAVLYSEQTLTDEQKVQARTNIGAVSEAKFDSFNFTVSNMLNEKRDIPSVTSSLPSNNQLILSDNTEYYLTDVSSLRVLFPDDSFEVWMSISFSATGSITVILPSETKYIGAAPTFSNGQTWEVSIKDKVAVCWRVE